ncbi:MAG: ferredoxin [Actinomycetota bacterium]
MAVCLHVDRALCQGHARCIDLAPDVFRFDDTEGQSEPVVTHWDDSHADRLRRVVSCCPEGAISLHDPEAGPSVAERTRSDAADEECAV